MNENDVMVAIAQIQAIAKRHNIVISMISPLDVVYAVSQVADEIPSDHEISVIQQNNIGRSVRNAGRDAMLAELQQHISEAWSA